MGVASPITDDMPEPPFFLSASWNTMKRKFKFSLSEPTGSESMLGISSKLTIRPDNVRSQAKHRPYNLDFLLRCVKNTTNDGRVTLVEKGIWPIDLVRNL